DVQWADEDTLALTTFLSRNLREAPVLFVVTIRTDELEAGSAVARWLAELDLDDWVDRIELQPLGRTEVLALVRSIDASSATGESLESIVERSGGNPFFVEQLASGGATRQKLPQRLRDVLGATAAAGRRVDDPLIAEVLQRPETAIADALRPALAGAILVEVVDAN